MLKRSVRRRLVNLARSGVSEMFMSGNEKTGGVGLGVKHNEIFVPVGYNFRTVDLARTHGKRLTGRNPKRWSEPQRQKEVA